MATHYYHHILFTVAAVLLLPSAYSIGVNYGTLGNNLAPPRKVAQFLQTRTIIDRVKIFNTDPDVLKAFAGTNISVVMTAANGDVPKLTDKDEAAKWVEKHVKPFYPKTKITCIGMGNEILHSLDPKLIDNLVPAMKTLHGALVDAGIKDIRVSTPSSLGIMEASEPPSKGKFRSGYWEEGVLKPMLEFLKETKSPFMVNPYPYFGRDPKKMDYATFQPNEGEVDNVTQIHYTNLFDAIMDSVYSAMDKIGYGDVEIMVAETGWPSLANPDEPEINSKSAAAYNGGLIKHVSSGVGTPLMPNRTFETYIFALFNENEKPGPTAEQNFGLFKPDFTPVYDCGIMLKNPKKDTSTKYSGDSPASSPAPGPGGSTEDNQGGPSSEGGTSPRTSPSKSPSSGTRKGKDTDTGSSTGTGSSSGTGKNTVTGTGTGMAPGKSEKGEAVPSPATGAGNMVSSNGLEQILAMMVVALVMAMDAFWW